MNAPRDVVMSIIERMTETSVPLLFWSGYSCAMLFSAVYLREWSVLISVEPQVRIFPRRWLGLVGEKVLDVWDAALKAVVGLVIFRPGISQVRNSRKPHADYADCRELSVGNTLATQTRV